MSQANKQVALKFLTSLVGGDVEALKTVVHDDIVAILPGSAKISGTRKYPEIMAVCALFPQITKGGLKPTVLQVTAEEGRVALEWEGHCTLVNGEQYNNVYHFLLFIRDGKVYRMKEYLDTQLADNVLVPVLSGLSG